METEETTCPHCGGRLIHRQPASWAAERDPRQLPEVQTPRLIRIVVVLAVLFGGIALLLGFCAALT